MTRFKSGQRVKLRLSLFKKLQILWYGGIWPPKGGRIIGWRSDMLAWEFRYHLGTWLAVGSLLELE